MVMSMDKYEVSVLGFGDNVVDIYEHTGIAYPGGNCVNFAVYAKLFGAKTSAYMGYFGDDLSGDFVRKTLTELGVDISHACVLHGENGYSKVSIIDGDRIFGDYNEGGIRGKTLFDVDDEGIAYMKGFDLVHSGNYSFMESQLPKIREAGIDISFDFSDDSSDAYYQEVAPYVTYAFCSKDGDEDEVKAHLRFVKALGPEIVCASRGAKGCILYDGESFYTQSAAPLEKLVDTMGAGDSLLTSFMTGYLARKKEGMPTGMAIQEAIAQAAVFASKVCAMEGAFGRGTAYKNLKTE